ncbi:uncharacterized protein MKZ38_001068 [Zalerion maritima]|uniref:SNF2 N-terminal domain-containing protein n=1 Tax=Zalerion maritima TaxID=339359 RepID=A0AAD5WU19_9PEZI|nr:uncharacterized protein MKZ38_001068 [Zalerion maritima]
MGSNKSNTALATPATEEDLRMEDAAGYRSESYLFVDETNDTSSPDVIDPTGVDDDNHASHPSSSSPIMKIEDVEEDALGVLPDLGSDPSCEEISRFVKAGLGAKLTAISKLRGAALGDKDRPVLPIDSDDEYAHLTENGLPAQMEKTKTPKSGRATEPREFWARKVREIIESGICEDKIWSTKIMTLESKKNKIRESLKNRGVVQMGDEQLGKVFFNSSYHGLMALDQNHEGDHVSIEIPIGPKATRIKAILDKLPKNASTKEAGDGWGHWALQSHLRHHQVIGVGLVLAMETCCDLLPDRPQGGILADQMEVCKTLQVITTMVSHPPNLEEKGKGGGVTLAVAPACVKSQWISEIKKHCPRTYNFPFFGLDKPWLDGGVLKYLGGKHGEDIQELLPSFAIIASFGDILNSLPRGRELQDAGLESWEKAQEINPDDYVEWEERMRKLCKPLLRMNFYRVVLDEGHTIKNDARKRKCQESSSPVR